MGNKKVGRLDSSDFGALANQQLIPFYKEIKISVKNSQAPYSDALATKRHSGAPKFLQNPTVCSKLNT
jgi:hypothetical protein